jgi:hypothetical protein
VPDAGCVNPKTKRGMRFTETNRNTEIHMKSVQIPAVPLSKSVVNGETATETPRNLSEAIVNGVESVETPMQDTTSTVNGTKFIVGNR